MNRALYKLPYIIIIIIMSVGFIPMKWNESFKSMLSYMHFSIYYRACHRDHMISLVRQLLRAEGLSLKWSETIINISQHVAGQVKPDVKHNGDDMDIRQYVMIKKVTVRCLGSDTYTDTCTQTTVHLYL